jgi:hypothetical protein
MVPERLQFLGKVEIMSANSRGSSYRSCVRGGAVVAEISDQHESECSAMSEIAPARLGWYGRDRQEMDAPAEVDGASRPWARTGRVC